ncbi:hypothetical protein CLOP_g6759 [Closterium sp. NIES-67]|nr:hypothetical protein CLOP_g6759 [Closterium sp. NIES-67]
MKHHMLRPWQRVASTSAPPPPPAPIPSKPSSPASSSYALPADAPVDASTTTDKPGSAAGAIGEGTRATTAEARAAGGSAARADGKANAPPLPPAYQQQQGGSVGRGGSGREGGSGGEGGGGVLLGQGMPATAVRVDRRTRKAVMDPAKRETYQVVLHFGIIDILQEYNTRKKAEHVCKRLRYDGTSISAVNPTLYASRFGSFIAVTFPSIDTKELEDGSV